MVHRKLKGEEQHKHCKRVLNIEHCSIIWSGSTISLQVLLLEEVRISTCLALKLLKKSLFESDVVGIPCHRLFTTLTAKRTRN